MAILDEMQIVNRSGMSRSSVWLDSIELGWRGSDGEKSEEEEAVNNRISIQERK